MLVQIQYSDHVTKYKVYQDNELIFDCVTVNGITMWEIFDIHKMIEDDREENGDMEDSDAEISEN